MTKSLTELSRPANYCFGKNNLQRNIVFYRDKTHIRNISTKNCNAVLFCAVHPRLRRCICSCVPLCSNCYLRRFCRCRPRRLCHRVVLVLVLVLVVILVVEGCRGVPVNNCDVVVFEVTWDVGSLSVLLSAEWVEAGVDEFLYKPVLEEKLRSAIEFLFPDVLMN